MAKCFGTIKKNNYASDYTKKLTSEIIFCNAKKYCNQIAKANSYEEKNLYNSLLVCPSVNKTNLVAGLYTKEDLNNVTTVCDIVNVCCDGLPYESCTIPKTLVNITLTPFYGFYKIDPKGRLFGNTECGVNNYRNYMVLNTNNN